MSFWELLGIVGGLVLFLYGIQTLGSGLKKVSGGKMESILQNLTSNKWKAALLGMLVTAVIQSSGATIVMVVGFVNSEIMTLSQAVGVILGANIGTTITAWLLSLTGIQGDNFFLQMLKPANFSPIVGLIGVFMMMMGKKQKHRDIGGIMTSFAVLMIGMDLMSDTAAPLASNPKFTGILTAFSNPILGMVAGLIVTVVLQSSSASIGILQAISLTGTLKMSSAIPVIMGENIGSAITGVMGAIGASRNAKRASYIQLFYCLLKTFVFMIVFYTLDAIVHFSIMDKTASPVSIAIFHSIFNIIAVAVTLPVSDFLVRMVEKAVPVTPEEQAEKAATGALQILDPKYLTSPSFALSQCKAAADQMAQYTIESMNIAMDLVLNYSEEQASKVDKLERTVDNYEDQLNTYLMRMSTFNFSPKDSHTFTLLMHCISDIERISDHALNVMQHAAQMNENNMTFTPKAQEELVIFHAALRDIMDRAFGALRTGDVSLASTVEPLEEVIDGINMEIKRRHVRRLRKGKCTVESGIALEDITTDYERVADHCNNIAVFMTQVRDDDLETHAYRDRLKEPDRAAFESMFLRYEEQYQLPPAKAASEEQPVLTENTANVDSAVSTETVKAVADNSDSEQAPAAKPEKEKEKEKKKKKLKDKKA